MVSTDLIVFSSIVAANLVALIIWLFYSMHKLKALKNHVNAQCVRDLNEFLQKSAIGEQSGKLDELLALLTKVENDVAMLFYLYCRIYKDFSRIEDYLNYKAFKSINKKRKPFPFNFVMAVLIASLGFAVGFGVAGTGLGAGFVSLNTLITALVTLFFAGIYTFFLIRNALIVNAYWMEFINLFAKINKESGAFFMSQQDNYNEFKNKVITDLHPSDKVKHRIEKIISGGSSLRANLAFGKKSELRPDANPDAVMHHKEPSASMPSSVAPSLAAAALPFAPVAESAFGFTASAIHPSQTSHNIQTSMVQAQNQMLQQMMMLMQQQTVQQGQMMQKAMESQHLIAQNVIQQNAMSLRLEAQKNLHQVMVNNPVPEPFIRPAPKLIDFPPRPVPPEITSKKPAFPPPSEIVHKETSSSPEPEIAQIKSDIPKTPVQASDPASKSSVRISNVPATAKPDISVKPAELSKAALQLIKAFKSLDKDFESKNKDRMPKKTVADVIVLDPHRNLSRVEERLGKLFNAKVFKYSDEEWKKLSDAVNT